jgi:peptidoglycan/xylan/chitin deacetylase (PgdA/CDA1 family)
MDAIRLDRRLLRTTGISITLAAMSVLTQSGAVTVTAAQHSSARVPVLMYHRISAAPPSAVLPHLWVSPRRFRAQLRALRRDGWTTITAEELGRALREGRSVGQKRFVITIDDGARDGWSNAAPILAQLGMRATFCVIPGRADRPWLLDFRRMRRLREAGHEIANHSLGHLDLRTVSGSALRRQVFGARRLIRERVGHTPRTFCYPMGFHDAEVRQVVAAAGNLLAFTTVEGARHSRANSMASPRVRVNAWTTPRELLARVRP